MTSASARRTAAPCRACRACRRGSFRSAASRNRADDARPRSRSPRRSARRSPRQKREAAELVALPFADLGGGDVADVVDVEEEQRAAMRVLECVADARRGGRRAGGRNRPGPRNRRSCDRGPGAHGPTASAGRANWVLQAQRIAARASPRSSTISSPSLRLLFLCKRLHT